MRGNTTMLLANALVIADVEAGASNSVKAMAAATHDAPALHTSACNGLSLVLHVQCVIGCWPTCWEGRC